MHEELDALPIAVIRLGVDGREQYVNARAADLVKQAGVQIDAGTLARTMGGFAEMPGARLELGSEARPRLIVDGPEGERVFGFQATTLASGGVLFAFQDITQIEQTQRERNRLLQLASISEVMPAVLHELKNPLASIAMAMELLIEDSAEDQRERLHAILSEVRRLSLTLDGLGRFRHEVRSARHHAIDLALREAFALLEPQASSRGILTGLDVRDMPLLPFEPAALRAVLFNLVTNSIHACQAGSRIDVAARFEREPALLVVTVSDTGAGMTHEVRARCTELFFTTKPRGSGIGLALCAGVADACGGSLEVDSEAGRGTRITLTLPINPPRRT